MKDNKEKKLTKKVTKSLPCKLTEEEVLKYGREMARALSERDRIQSELDGIKSEYKAKISEQTALIEKFSVRVHSGIESRDVECEETKNWTKINVEVKRLDTGSVIESRPMREDEKQMEMITEE